MRQSEERYTKNLSRLDNRPAALREKIFSKLFAAASVARFTPTELREYEDSLKAYRDIKNSLDTAEAKGRAEGMAEGMAEGIAVGIVKVARKLLTMGMTADYIADVTGLSKEEIKDIADKQEANGRS